MFFSIKTNCDKEMCVHWGKGSQMGFSKDYRVVPECFENTESPITFSWNEGNWSVPMLWVSDIVKILYKIPR